MDERNALFAPKPEWGTGLPPITPNPMLQMLTRTPRSTNAIARQVAPASACGDSGFKGFLSRNWIPLAAISITVLAVGVISLIVAFVRRRINEKNRILAVTAREKRIASYSRPVRNSPKRKLNNKESPKKIEEIEIEEPEIGNIEPAEEIPQEERDPEQDEEFIRVTEEQENENSEEEDPEEKQEEEDEYPDANQVASELGIEKSDLQQLNETAEHIQENDDTESISVIVN